LGETTTGVMTFVVVTTATVSCDLLLSEANHHANPHPPLLPYLPPNLPNLLALLYIESTVKRKKMTKIATTIPAIAPPLSVVFVLVVEDP